MTFKEAMDRVLSGHKDCKVITVLEFSDKFVVSIQPKNWNPDEILLDPYFSVDKKTGKVSEWSPIMDPEGFKKALKDGVVYKEGDKIEEEPSKELAHYMEYTPGDLMHFGIKGMKWGIRRFQPYQKGERVKGGKEVGAATKVKQRPSVGNIIERYKTKKVTKKRVEAAKKAREKRKADADFEEAKKKAVESGTIEDLAKFKGKLSNEEYNRAFLRLQNEQKVAALVQANQKTVWDKIDKGMQIVQKLGGYANTVATAKENLNKLDDAFHKKEKEDAKDKKEAAKRAFMNTASYEDLVKRANDYGLDTKDYSMVVARIKGEKDLRADYDKQVAANKAKEAEEAAFRKEQNAHAREQANNLKNGFYKTPPPASSSDDTYMRNRSSSNSSSNDNRSSSSPEAESGKRVISGFRTADKPVSYNSAQTLSFGESTVRRLSATAPKASQVKKDMEPTAAEKERATRLANIRQTYSVNRTISGANKGNAGTTYKQQSNLEFGNSSVKKFSAKPATPSKVVTDTRQTVANTQAESARQKEVDKKRKAKLKR